MTAAFEIREIGDDDLAEVVALLCEGFRRRTPEYWRTGLQKLANRERPPDTEKYGYSGMTFLRIVIPLLTLIADLRRNDRHARMPIPEVARRYSSPRRR